MMPPNRYFTVTQERSIKVQASNLVDAGIVAQHAFDGESLTPEQNRTIGGFRGTVKDTDMTIREEL